MRQLGWMFGLSCLLAFPAFAAPTNSTVGAGRNNSDAQAVKAGDVAAGKAKSEDLRCQECHGSDGNGDRPERKYPKLAGQFSAYLVKQMRDYRTGARKNEFMAILANNMEDVDFVDIAAYYASRDKMHGADAIGVDSVGKNLFLNGDANRNILPCNTCHGSAVVDAGGNHYPIIAGQERDYLERQILAWKQGERNNSAGGIMNLLVKSLTDSEVQALAAYISGL